MKLWTRCQAFVATCWRKLKNVLTRPSIETITGMNAGAAMGRVFLWSWLGGVCIFSGLYVVGAIALAMAAWELWMNYHVFRFLSQLFAMTYGKTTYATAHVNLVVDTPVSS